MTIRKYNDLIFVLWCVLLMNATTDTINLMLNVLYDALPIRSHTLCSSPTVWWWCHLIQTMLFRLRKGEQNTHAQKNTECIVAALSLSFPLFVLHRTQARRPVADVRPPPGDTLVQRAGAVTSITVVVSWSKSQLCSPSMGCRFWADILCFSGTFRLIH